MKHNTIPMLFWGATLALVSHAAIAHDVSLEPAGDAYVVLYGHGKEWIHYKPEQVEQVTGYDAAGKATAIAVEHRPVLIAGLDEVRLEHEGAFIKTGDAGMVTLLFQDGYWTETSDGWSSLPKNHFREYMKSNHYLMYNKTLLRWEAAYGKAVGLAVEIVPLANPWSGIDSLPIQVVHQGKPAAGVKVEIDGDPQEYVTDAQGKTSVPLRKGGVHYLSTNREQKLDGDPKADSRYTYSNLIFTR